MADAPLNRDTILVGDATAITAGTEGPSPFTVIPYDLERDVDQLTDTAWARRSRRSPAALALNLPPHAAERVRQLCEQNGVNGAVARNRGRDKVRNLLANLPLLTQRPSLQAHPGMLRGLPAFIIGAGAGLDENRDLLGDIRHRGLTIALNAATHAVPSHVELTTESNDVTRKLAGTAPVRVASIVGHPDVTRPENCSFTWSSELGEFLSEATGIPGLPSSASGTTAAVSLAIRLGCAPIVLVGQDLAFVDDRVYAETTGFGGDRVRREGSKVLYDWGSSGDIPRPSCPLPPESDLVELPGVSGPVMTSQAFRNVAWFLGAQARDAYVIQTSTRGCRIENARHVSLEHVLFELPVRKASIQLTAGRAQPAALRWMCEQQEFLKCLVHLWCAQDVGEILDEWRSGTPHGDDASMGEEMVEIVSDIEKRAEVEVCRMLREAVSSLAIELPKVYSLVDAAFDSAAFAKTYAHGHLPDVRPAEAVRAVDAVESLEADGAGR